MKKIIVSLIAAVALVIGLSSCATVSSSQLFNTNNTNTVVKLTQDNFKVVGTATGTYEAVYWFGVFGGPSKANGAANAVADMYKNANLSGSQAAINVVTSVKAKTIFGVYDKVTYEASCQIVEFTK